MSSIDPRNFLLLDDGPSIRYKGSPMRLLLKPNLCMAMGFTSTHERQVCTEALRFKNPNPPRSSLANPYYDGYISFWLDPQQTKFPTGFFSHVYQHLLRHGVTPHVEIVKSPQRASIQIDPNICDGMTLRPYQLEAVTTAIAKGRGIITAPPRSGKTLIQAAVMKTLDRKSVLFVQRANLLEQHVASLRSWGVDAGVVQGSRKDFDHQYTVAMAQTVWAGIKDKAMIEWLDSIEVLQCDECHNFAADTMYRVGLACPASWRLGYSGTPFDMGDMEASKFNSDTWRLAGLFGPPIVNVSLGTLTNLGLMVPVSIYQVKQTDPDIRDIDGTDWHSVYDAGVTGNQDRNEAITSIAKTLTDKGYVPLVLVKILDHGKNLFDQLQAAGMAPMFASGGKSIQLCEGPSGNKSIRGSIGDAYQMLLNGQGNILIATQIGDEGVDLPHVDALILAVGGKADQVTTQRIFRPLTSTGGKSQAIVVDFDDRTHGVLKKHSAMRRRIYRTLGFNPKIISLDALATEIPSLIA